MFEFFDTIIVLKNANMAKNSILNCILDCDATGFGDQICFEQHARIQIYSAERYFENLFWNAFYQFYFF